MDTWHAAAHLGLAGVISAPLLYAGTSKLVNASRFAGTIPKFDLGLLPPTPAAARAVAVVEVLVGSCLMLFAVPASALAVVVVYACFAVIMGRAWLRGSTGDCGCFGALGGRIGVVAVGRNAALAVAALGLAYCRAAEVVAAYEARSALPLIIAIGLGAATVETILEIRRSAP